jgi:predicted nucleotidyltransferase
LWQNSSILATQESQMQRDEILSTLKQHQTALKGLGVRSLALFGSVARDEATSTSDVDILVEFEPPITFDRYMDVKFYLEDHLERKVDLVSWKSLKPQIRATVEKEAIYVA